MIISVIVFQDCAYGFFTIFCELSICHYDIFPLAKGNFNVIGKELIDVDEEIRVHQFNQKIQPGWIHSFKLLRQ